MATWLICGGRTVADKEEWGETLAVKQLEFVCDTLDALYLPELGTRLSPELVIHGNARGTDALGEAWAIGKGIPTKAFPAEWGLYGKGAGPKRNQQMLDEGNPDIVIAFFDCDFEESKGTRDMVDQAYGANKTVLTYWVPR